MTDGGILILSIISFIIGIFITRAIFSIPAFLKIQKAKLQILTEIALKQGVKADVLKGIYLENDVIERGKTNEEMRA